MVQNFIIQLEDCSSYSINTDIHAFNFRYIKTATGYKKDIAYTTVHSIFRC